ncbi:hypothetical protein HMPREF0870_00104 [Veillonella atypica KON]|uniref:Uncharacterized protein n=1 Tax=Veillonella atypica KON TaxID=1128111 RepID=A0ABN0INC7_9FIRM|nr:hypothetical protein HMPREF0870_00104 [Veillonella atypica KON]
MLHKELVLYGLALFLRLWYILQENGVSVEQIVADVKALLS